MGFKEMVCVRCNAFIAKYRGFGIMEISCPNCHCIQYISDNKQLPGQVSGDFRVDSVSHRCTLCERDILKTEGDIEFETKCKYCKQNNSVQIPTGVPKEFREGYIKSTAKGKKKLKELIPTEI